MTSGADGGADAGEPPACADGPDLDDQAVTPPPPVAPEPPVRPATAHGAPHGYPIPRE
ncbi:hypothetical protein [Microbacterium sp. 179-I 3D4 NHS]|uniref:hypothetical protein n=1 Tax=Microbacterium sp. 179-I 3D4 NHS TaxID=3142381 RepID=UPI0039A01B17